MKTKILSVVLVTTFLISTVAFAQPIKKEQQLNKETKQREMMMKKRQRIQNGDRQSFLTEEQKETIKGLHFETVKKVKPLKNELRELAARQQTLTTADNADLKAINKNIDKMAGLKAEVAKIMAAQHQQVRSLLNEEQLVKFDSMKEKRGKGQAGDFKQQRIKRDEIRRFGARI